MKITIHERADITESEMFEMGNKWKSATGLPMNIWLDENQTYKMGGHGKRLKFQLDANTKMDIHNSSVMGLDGELKVPLPKHMGLALSDIDKLRNWVANNRYALELVADVMVPLDDIFPYMIKGGEAASPEAIAELNAKVDELRIDK